MRYNEGLPIFLGVPKFNRTDSRDSREDHKDCNFLSNCRTEFLDRSIFIPKAKISTMVGKPMKLVF